MDFEKKHEIILPETYKEISDLDLTFVLAGDTWEIIKSDYLDFYLSAASETSGFPINGLPIAHNHNGNYIFILPFFNSNQFSSNIFLFNHETKEVYTLKETIQNFTT